MTDVSPSARMFRLTYSLVVHCALYAAARLGVADVLAGGPRSSGEIAAAVGSGPDATYRLLRALASEGVLTESEGGRFGLTPLGETLRRDVPARCAAGSASAGRLPIWRRSPRPWMPCGPASRAGRRRTECRSSTTSASIPMTAPPSTPQ